MDSGGKRTPEIFAPTSLENVIPKYDLIEDDETPLEHHLTVFPIIDLSFSKPQIGMFRPEKHRISAVIAPKNDSLNHLIEEHRESIRTIIDHKPPKSPEFHIANSREFCLNNLHKAPPYPTIFSEKSVKKTGYLRLLIDFSQIKFENQDEKSNRVLLKKPQNFFCRCDDRVNNVIIQIFEWMRQKQNLRLEINKDNQNKYVFRIDGRNEYIFGNYFFFQFPTVVQHVVVQNDLVVTLLEKEEIFSGNSLNSYMKLDPPQDGSKENVPEKSTKKRRSKSTKKSGGDAAQEVNKKSEENFEKKVMEMIGLKESKGEEYLPVFWNLQFTLPNNESINKFWRMVGSRRTRKICYNSTLSIMRDVRNTSARWAGDQKNDSSYIFSSDCLTLYSIRIDKIFNIRYLFEKMDFEYKKGDLPKEEKDIYYQGFTNFGNLKYYKEILNIEKKLEALDSSGKKKESESDHLSQSDSAE